MKAWVNSRVSAARPLRAGARRGSAGALLVAVGLAFAPPVRAAEPLTDPPAAQDLERAETLIELGEFDEAVAILSELTDRGFAQAAVRLADLLYGEIALVDEPVGTPEQRAALDLAIGFYRQATSVDGDHYDQASRRLARLLLFRENDSESVRAAVDQLRRLTVLGSGPAAYDLGRAYLYGRGVAADPREADRFLGLAMDLGEMKAARVLGLVFARGIDRPPDPEAAVHYLQLAVDSGDYEAAGDLATVHAGLGEHDKAVAAAGTAIEILENLYAADPQPVYAMRLAALHLRDPYWPQDPAKGIEWLDRAATENTGLAAYRLFQIYAAEGFGPHDPEAAWAYAQTVVEARYWNAVPTIAHHYLVDACAAPLDAERAVQWLTMAAEAGDADSMAILSAALGETWPCVAGDIDRSRHWMLAAATAEWGTNEAVLDAARRALQTAVDDRQVRHALDLLEVAAARGSVAAQTDLGRYLAEVSDRPEDRRRGLELLRTAATEENSDRAMSILGRALLYSADAAERDEAMVWLTRAAGYGRADAMRILGRIHLEGLVAEPDVDRAERLLSRALAYGDGEAGTLLADLYRSGIFGEVDLERAHAVLEQAAALGSAEAMLRLSEAYRLGLGVDAQPELADELLGRAAAAGNRQAQMLLDSAPPPLPEPSSHEG